MALEAAIPSSLSGPIPSLSLFLSPSFSHQYFGSWEIHLGRERRKASSFSVAHGFTLESGTGIATVLRTRADTSSHHMQNRRVVSQLTYPHFSIRWKLGSLYFCSIKKKNLYDFEMRFPSSPPKNLKREYSAVSSGTSKNLALREQLFTTSQNRYFPKWNDSLKMQLSERNKSKDSRRDFNCLPFPARSKLKE